MEVPQALLDFVFVLLGLVPVIGAAAPLIALIVDALKKAGVLSDGYAGLVSAGLNFVAFGLIYFFGAEKVEGVIGVLLSLTPFVLGLFASAVASGLWHKVAVKLGFGFSQPK